MNARIQACLDEEWEAVGPYHFDPDNTTIERMAAATEDNRNRCVDFAISNKMILANTWFRKPQRKL
eukprot:1133403-Prorocentrum_lima.AAC.1